MSICHRPGHLVVAWGALLASALAADPADRPHYQAPTWQPRAVLPAVDALRGDFWKPSPPVNVDYQDPGFAEDRLSAVPAPGVHPRVVMNPGDVERIRAKVALGDAAPLAFRVQWQRAAAAPGAFYALVTKDDVLGRRLAADLVEKIKTLEPKLDNLDRQPDRDNLWAVERSLVASGDPNPPSEIWSLLDYDYLHGWMTPEEREAARRVIARLVKNRVSNFMVVPDHFMNNNHEGFGMEYLRLMLLIEGEEGFDQPVYDLAARKARAMLDWYLSKDGMCYESIKGWLNITAFTAVGLRQRDLLKHSHLRAKMDFFRAALRWEDGQWRIRDEMRASAFHVIWMMHYYHPQDQAIDLLYRATFTSHPFLVDAKERWPNPVGIVPELLMLYADEGITTADGKPQDWNDQARIDALKLPITWRDDLRGYVEARNTWRKDDLHLGFVCKQDFYYGGHEGSENNRITLWSGGVNWIQDLNMLAVKATSLQNMVTIDGKGLQWPPVPGVWLGAVESPQGLTAAGDGRMGYSYAKRMQVHPLDSPSAKLPYYAPFAEGNFDLSRDLQVAFHPGTVAWNDGYAHTDYGPWSGETRLVEHYQDWNPMQRAYRTVHLARGERPYVLVVDDLKKDDQKHLFEWNISLPAECEPYDIQTPEVQFQNVRPSERRDGSFLLVTNASRDGKTGALAPKKGDPACLVKVLWRNADYGYPIPRFERFQGRGEMKYQGFAHLTIPAFSVSPEFRVLVYPHRFGDPLPTTVWNQDRTELTVTIDKQVDRYTLATADGGRTALAMVRNQTPALRSEVPPSRPVLRLDGVAWDPADQRTTREDGQPLAVPFHGTRAVHFERPKPPAVIRYTLDGSDPTATSPAYEGVVEVTASCTLKARRFDPSWVCGPTVSDVTSAVFRREDLSPGLAVPPTGSRPGLLARVYETKTVMWNDRGFFDAAKVMLPDLEALTPIHTAITDGMAIPRAIPRRPMIEQTKGFYRWTGWVRVDAPSAYTFAIDSCGPVTLDIDGRGVIDHHGIFHQQQAVRTGTTCLAPGWHAIDLVVCDPLFWNTVTFGLMPTNLSIRTVDGPLDLLDRFRCQTAGVTVIPEPTVATRAATTDLPGLEPGLVQTSYERSGLTLDPQYLDIDGLPVLRTALVPAIEANLKPSIVRVYDAWFKAPLDGEYGFELPTRRGDSAGLGEARTAYQNQLRIDDEIVVQHGVPGRLPLGRIALKAGWHHLSLRLGSSPGDVTIIWPDGLRQPLDDGLLFRAIRVAIRPEGSTTVQDRYEIYRPTAITLALPADPSAVLRVTTDGSDPTATSPVVSGPLTIDQTTTVKAQAFRDGRPIAVVSQAVISRVALPTADLLAVVDTSVWKAGTGLLPLASGATAWISPTATVDGDHLVTGFKPSAAVSADANVARGSAAGLRLANLVMRDNALTVALRVKSDGGTGKLFGKDGYSAFGKAYKTVGCSLDKNKVVASPGRIQSPVLAAGWHDIVLTGDAEALILYVDGVKVASGPGSATLGTDSFDLLTDHAASLAWLRVYNRVLAPADVAQLSGK